MTDVYVLLVEERHCDVDALLFVDADAAINAAKEMVVNFGGFDLEEGIRISAYDEELNPSMIQDGWIYNCVWGSEGDSVRVMKRPIK